VNSLRHIAFHTESGVHWSDEASQSALLTAFRRLSPGDRVLALITTRQAGIPAVSYETHSSKDQFGGGAR
jgi:hypothetical protein